MTFLRVDKSPYFRWQYVLLGIAVSTLLFYRLIPLPTPLFPNDYSTVILGDPSTDGTHKFPILRVFLNRDEQWCLPPNPDLKIPDKLKTTVLFFEDQYFYYHPGVNPGAVVRAFWQNFNSEKRVSGASTITMQVARLFNPKSRNYVHKMQEILQALKMEIRYSKEEILQLYLNHAPYGGNIIGYQAASLRYFGKLPEALTWGEAATIAVLPNAPGLISPDAAPDKLREKRNKLLRRMKEAGIISDETLALSILEPTPESSHPFPWQAPHLSQWLKTRYGQNGGLLKTTIIPKIQSETQRLLAEHISFINPQGIRNGVALVVETQTGNVRAYVGSQDFFDAGSQGQVDGIRAPRSSGSILKPFLYALAMDDGLILPQTMLHDVPTFYGAFSPQNASEQYDGIVPARQALIRSLNVPAVRLLNSYGLYPFYRFLQQTGVGTLFRNADDYGLPLIIGGAEVTPWDAAMLFRGLGNGGNFSPLTVLQKNGAESQQRVSATISPGASFLTLEILRDLKRPGAEFYWELFQNQFPLAWKTGTSYGQRDAWAVGVSPEWTIAIWVGNFSGEGNANLTGSKSAGPLLFDVFNSLPKNPELTWFAVQETDLQNVEICRETGFLASQNCPEPIFASAPRHAKPLKICNFHRKIFISDITGYEVCSRCWTATEYHAQQMLIFPPDVVQYVRGRGQMVGKSPVHNPECSAIAGNSPIEILYPQENARLWVPRDFGSVLQKVTARAAHRDNRHKIFWYLNNRFLGATENRHEKPLECRQGWNELEIIDETGFSELRKFFVTIRP